MRRSRERRSRVAQVQQNIERQKLKLSGDVKRQTLIELIEAAPEATVEQKERLDTLSTRELRERAAELKVSQELLDKALAGEPVAALQRRRP